MVSSTAPQPQSAHQDRRERDHCENPRSPQATRREPVYGSGTLPSRRGDTQRPASMLPTLWGPSSTKPSARASRRKLRKPSRTSCALLQTNAPLVLGQRSSSLGITICQPWYTSKLFLRPHGYPPSPSSRHSLQAPPPSGRRLFGLEHHPRQNLLGRAAVETHEQHLAHPSGHPTRVLARGF